MIREQSTNTLLCLVCHLLTVSRPGLCDSDTGWAVTVNKYRREHDECRITKLILFDSNSTMYIFVTLTIWFIRTKSFNFWTVWHLFCNFWRPSLCICEPAPCLLMAIISSTKQKTMTNSGGWALIIMATQLCYCCTHRVTLHSYTRPMTLILFGLWPVGCMMASWVFVIICKSQWHTNTHPACISVSILCSGLITRPSLE